MIYPIPLYKIPDNFDLTSLQDKRIAEMRMEGKELQISIQPKYEDDASEIIQDLVEKIREQGGEVATSSLNYPILNMTCAACASSTQNILGFVPGVLDASVNYGNGKGHVTYIPSITNAEAMKTALQEVGYDMLIEEERASVKKLQEIEKENYAKLRRQTLWSGILSVPLVIIGMFYMHAPYANITMLLLATPILFIAGRRFFIGAWKQAKHKSANMDTLVALSTGIAYLFSIFNMIFPEFWTSRGLEPHVYFESVGVVITFILLGKMLEARAKGNTSEAIRKLMGLQPSTVTVFRNDNPTQIAIDEVVMNDIVLVKPGERVAVDGVVTDGMSFVDESMLSGEPIPVEKKLGDSVFAGTMNQKGSFRLRASKVGKDTLLAHIIRTVDEAQGSKAPVQGLVDKIAAVFVPVVMGIAVLSLVVWMIFGGNQGFVYGLMAMVTVLVIACPCALGLATPTAIMVGIGKGAESGILIKDAKSLENAKHLDVVVLDKTGTITEGRPEVESFFWSAESEPLHRDIFYSIEHNSEHPLAEAVTRAMQSDVRLLDDIKVEQISGKGIEGTYQNKKYFIGSESFILSKKIIIPNELYDKIHSAMDKARTIAIFADENRAFAAVSITDKIKETSLQAVNQLQKMGIDVAIFTGDNEKVAADLAKQLGITNYKAGVLPEQKASLVKELQQQGKKVAMVGDGINDSAALAQADVSIAMGKGSDIAMDVADMTIISSDLLKIPKAIHLSKETVKTIRQNLFWAFIYNVIGIPIAAGILYPFTGFLLNPMFAGAAMALSSVSVVTNSLRLKSKKI